MDYDALIRRAQDGDQDAADRLSADPDALPSVLRALEDAKPVGLLPEVVFRMNNSAKVQILIAELASQYFDVLRVSALALGRSRDGRALEPLLAILEDTSLTESDRSFAAEALGDLGDPAAIDALRATIEATRPDLEWNDWPVLLVQCAIALAKLGDHSGSEPVLEALRSDMETARSLAASALRIVTGPQVTENLSERVGDRSREVRLAVIDPLFLLGTPEAVEALIPACQDEVDDIVLRALQRLGDLLGEDFGEDDGEEEARAVWEQHRREFRSKVCHRWGHPLNVADLPDAWEATPDRREDIAAELTVVTGLAVTDIIRDDGINQLRELISTRGYVEGGLYKWGRRQSIS